MERHLGHKEYSFYWRLRRPIGGHNILKNEEEYNEYWEKIDWIQYLICEIELRQKKKYKWERIKYHILNTLGVCFVCFAFVSLPLLSQIFRISQSIYISVVIFFSVIGIHCFYASGFWNGREPKPPKEATVADVLKLVNFKYGTPLVLALIIAKSIIEKDFARWDFRLCGSKYIVRSWDGLLEPSLYMLLADALILDECLSNKYMCKKGCVRCKAKIYNDDYDYSSHKQSFYEMSPTDIIRIYEDEYLGRNGSPQPLPQYIEQSIKL